MVSSTAVQAGWMKEMVETRNVTSCANFFKPCSCSTDFNGKNSVTCQYVTPDDIYEAFHQVDVNATNIFTFTYLVRNMSEVDLPADLLGEHKITGLLSIKWWGINQEAILKNCSECIQFL